MKTLSLKFRFAIVVSIGALALVIGMGAIAVHFAESDLRATLSSQQLGLVTRTAEDIDARLKQATDSLTETARAIPREILTDQAAFAQFNAQHPALLQMYDEIMVLDAQGRVAVAYPQKDAPLVGLDLGDRGYFQRVMASAKPVVSDPLRGRVTGAPLVNVAAPVVDADGSVGAVLVGVMSIAKRNLLGSLPAARLGQSGYFIVVTSDPDPIYLAHPDPSRLMQKVSRATNPALARVLDATVPGVGVGKLDDGADVLIAYRPLTTSNWILVAILPEAEAFASLDRARDRTLRIGFLAALVVLPLVWLFAWRLLRPLSVLREQVEQIASDPHGAAYATVGRHEVGKVAQAFNAMLADQRRSEALRVASDKDRRRLVATLESSRDFVAMTDPEGHLTYLNASGRLCCGVGLNDDLGHTTLQDYFPEWAVRKLMTVGVPAALKDGIWVGETAVLAADGSEVPVDHTVIAHRNVDGEVEFFSSLLHDTSAAKATSAAMRSSEARMLSIADALPVLVSFIDRDYRYRFVNSRYEDHFGIDRTEMVGRSIVELIGQEAYERYRPFLERAALGETQVFEIESHAGLRPVHFLVKLIPQSDEDGHVTGYHFIHQDVTDHKAEHQRLSQLARADTLTGLLNRAGFDAAIDEAMRHSHSHGSAMALFYLDVDRFKGINDQHGHLVGDALLRAFADRLVRAVRSADVVARLGGDEFVVIAEGLRNGDDVRSIARKILGAMRTGFDVGGVLLSITTSIGVASYNGEAMTPDELVKRADAALYRAKNAGRDRYDLDDPSQEVSPVGHGSNDAPELSLIF